MVVAALSLKLIYKMHFVTQQGCLMHISVLTTQMQILNQSLDQDPSLFLPSLILSL